MRAADVLFPFSAVLGQDDLRLALILNAVHPAIGGVLARGEKGTAKSTLVRALAAVLPSVRVVAGCRFACDPDAADPGCPDGPHAADVSDAPDGSDGSDGSDDASGASGAGTRPVRLVELPVGASEDRLTGSLDLQRALGEGVAAFQPGLLAAAHRGVLYVDEVNLLPDHLVDVLLDAAAMGVAHVERDGVSVRHAARFILVGTMNPEEGELRPQLLDRFGLTVEVAASREPKRRAEVVRRRLAFEADPIGYAGTWSAADRQVGERIAAARAVLGSVVLPDAELERIARVCAAFEVDGMRADLVTARAAVALAAWRGLDAVTKEEVRDAARLALPHRRRRDPFDAPGLDQDLLEDALKDPDPPEPDPDADPDTDSHGESDPDGDGNGDGGDSGGADDGGVDGSDGVGDQSAYEAHASDRRDGAPEASASSPPPPPSAQPPQEAADAASDAPSDPWRVPGAGAAPQAVVGAAEPFRTRLYSVPGVGEGVPGRRSAGRSTGRGRTVGAEPPTRGVAGVHLPATVRAAAAHQADRGRVLGAPLLLRSEDLRVPLRRDRESNLVLFVVDASGSMGARSRMAAVKGAVLSLLLDAYQRRDKVGMVSFRGGGASVALPPTGSVEAAAARLAELPTGGRTPLAAGLTTAALVLRRERLRDPRRRPLMVVVTDGRATGAGGFAAAERVAARFGEGAGLGSGGAGGASRRVASIVVDCETGPVRLGLAARLAAALGGEHVPMARLAADSLAAAVRATTKSTAAKSPTGTAIATAMTIRKAA